MPTTHSKPRWLTPVLAVAATSAVLATSACSGVGGSGGGADGDVTINIATVSNPDMERMQELVPEYEKAHPGVTVKFTTLPENTLRDKLTQDVATGTGSYDLVTVGSYEAPIWASNGWLENIQSRAEETDGYDVDDLVEKVRDSLSYEGDMYAVPFYAESSFLMYRKDLFEAAGITMADKPTWDQIAEYAAKLNDPANGVAGICLRGEAGWGSMMSVFTTMAHAYGAHLYDADYVGGFDTPEFKAALTDYVDLATNYGEPGASSASFPECLNVFSQGQAAMWYDATVAASAVTDPEHSTVAENVGFAPAPSAALDTGGWLWTWSLAMTSTSKNKDAAWDFMSWASSKEYMSLVGDKFGPNLIPPGTRYSTYDLPEYQEAAGAYADLTLNAIEGAQVSVDGAAELERSFYIAIPQWQDLGTTISQSFSQAIAGSTSVDDAIKQAQEAADSAAEELELGK